MTSADIASSPSNSAAAAPRSILIVEDNPDSRETLRQLLEIWGHRVETAADGPEGVRRGLESKPDAAVVDIGLPGMDGLEVAKRLRTALGGAILLIALTAYSQKEFHRQALACGFDHFMSKPADLDQLARLLRA